MSVIELYTVGITVDEFSRVSSFLKVMFVVCFENIKILSSGVGTNESFHLTDGHTFT